MPDLEKKVNGDTNAKTRNLLTSIVAAAGILAAIIAPMQAEINWLRHENEKNEARSAVGDSALDEKLQMELKATAELIEVEIADLHILFDEKMKNIREVTELRLKGHEAAVSHPMIFDEVRTLWRYHEKPVGGTP